MRTKIGIICMVLGVVLIFAAGGLLIYNRMESEQAGQASEAVMSSLLESLGDAEDKKTIVLMDTEEEEKVIEMSVADIDGYDYIGYLGIPNLELTLPVMAELSYAGLKIAPCRQSGSVEGGGLIIAAHNYSRHFGALYTLAPQDQIIFTDMDNISTLYTVYAVETVAPTGEAVYDPKVDLTLYTCTIGGENRVVVRCYKTENN